jgi:hypothetical protein
MGFLFQFKNYELVIFQYILEIREFIKQSTKAYLDYKLEGTLKYLSVKVSFLFCGKSMCKIQLITDTRLGQFILRK